MEPYDATETKDIDHFLTVPFMVERFRGEVGLERGARVRFEGVVGRGIGRGGFARDMLLGTVDEFEWKVGVFVEEVKVCMVGFVVGTYGSEACC